VGQWVGVHGDDAKGETACLQLELANVFEWCSSECEASQVENKVRGAKNHNKSEDI
jgi:hypothetical protein